MTSKRPLAEVLFPTPAGGRRMEGKDRTMDLSEGAVEVHLCAPASQNAAQIRYAKATLAAEERDVASRFASELDQRAYVVAHALARRVIAGRLGGSAAELEFARSSHGKPELRWPSQLRFNLAHTRRLVGVALTLHDDIGFDLEEVREEAPLQIAERFFSAAEVVGFNGLDLRAKRERFFALWTLKEAYVKGRGLGLTIPLRSFSIEPCSDGTAELTLQPPDDTGVWSFASYQLENHWLAVAVRRAGATRSLDALEAQRESAAVPLSLRVHRHEQG